MTSDDHAWVGVGVVLWFSMRDDVGGPFVRLTSCGRRRSMRWCRERRGELNPRRKCIDKREP